MNPRRTLGGLVGDLEAVEGSVDGEAQIDRAIDRSGSGRAGMCALAAVLAEILAPPPGQAALGREARSSLSRRKGEGFREDVVLSGGFDLHRQSINLVRNRVGGRVSCECAYSDADRN